MRFLFYLGHPAHYLNVSVVIHQLSLKGHEILLVARDKDVLFDLIKDIPYEAIYLKKRKGGSKLALIGTVLRREVALFRIARRWKPDLMIGTDIVITHIGNPQLTAMKPGFQPIPFQIHVSNNIGPVVVHYKPPLPTTLIQWQVERRNQ